MCPFPVSQILSILLQRTFCSPLSSLFSFIIIILSVVFYGCETWPVTVREEHRLGVLLRRMLHVRTQKVGSGRRLELHNLYASPNVSKVIS
jgi:hypothetical protein